MHSRFATLPPLILGTVQLGMPYGLGAARGGIDEPAAHAILDAAWTRGIRGLDTARAYGEAESRIGRWLGRCRPSPAPFIVSKFPPLGESESANAVEAALTASLRQLARNRIDIYLAHRGSDLLRPGVIAILRDLTAAGKIGGFGASVYGAEEGRSLLGIEELTALQLPLHLANTAASDAGLLEAAARRGVSVFARSVFLQGLLLASPHALERRFSAAAPVLVRLEDLARRAGTTRAALALSAVRALPAVAAIVVGVDSVAQLDEILAAQAEPVARATVSEALAIGRDFPPKLADPRLWQP